MKIERRPLLLGAASAAAAGLLAPAGPALAAKTPMPEVLRQAIERQPFSPVMGNPEGDITLTEFFDYNCPYCKAVPALLTKLIEEDKNLRIVLREWPVLGPDSEIVARMSLAALKQGKYWEFHHRMLSSKGVAAEGLALFTAEKVGLDMERLERDMQSPEVLEHISRSMELGDHMRLMGTPTFLAGHDARFGAQSLRQLRALIKTARSDLG